MGFLERRFLHRVETELDAIVGNLRHVLEAKRGASAFFPDFGLSEPTHASAEESVLRFSEEIRAAVARYEPRVRVLEIVEQWGDDDRPRLEVHLELRATGTRLALAVDPATRRAERLDASDDEPEP